MGIATVHDCAKWKENITLEKVESENLFSRNVHTLLRLHTTRS